MNAPKIAMPLALLSTLALAAPGYLIAQDKPLVAQGERVRITAPSIAPKRVVGTIQSLDESTLILGQMGEPSLNVPIAAVTEIEVSRGQRSHGVEGTFIGLAVGVVSGAAIGYAIGKDDCGEYPDLALLVGCVERGSAALGGAALFGAIGAGIGAIAGLSSKSDIWEQIPLDQLRIEPSPIAPDGVSVSAALRL